MHAIDTRRLQEDALFRMLVMSCVAAAIREDERADQAAHDIATRAASLAVSRLIREGDGLAALIAERDLYKQQSLELAKLVPLRPVVIATEAGQKEQQG